MSHGLKPTAGVKGFGLTRLELIGLTLTANGLSVSEAALRLSVSEAEVETALLSAESKLGASNRMHAIAVAIKQGSIGIEVKG